MHSSHVASRPTNQSVQPAWTVRRNLHPPELIRELGVRWLLLAATAGQGEEEGGERGRGGSSSSSDAVAPACLSK